MFWSSMLTTTLLQGGITFSNAVTTVSPTYAKEALDGGAAGWLRATLARPEVRGKFRGVLNGIDNQDWNPSTDKHLEHKFGISNFSRGKVRARALPCGLFVR